MGFQITVLFCSVEILKRGGNAADAAVAVAAGMQLTAPCLTGLGGDAFCLFYDARTKQVKALNGRSERKLKSSDFRWFPLINRDQQSSQEANLVST